jgi:NADPH2:quinone reductase
MYAWTAHSYGPLSSLCWEHTADPPLQHNQLRIEIKAVGVNFADSLLVAGHYQFKPPPPFVPGFEIAGIVVESRVPSLPVGTRVASTLPCGGFATHAVASPNSTYVLANSMPFDHAAAITMTYQTAWFALHRRAQLLPGEWLLVHAGAGGVGSAAIQLGNAIGARVIATAGGDAKVALCRSLGAEIAVDYKKDNFVDVVQAATAAHGADVVFDPVGGETFLRSTKCIAFEGRIVVVGFASGTIPDLKANHVFVKNYAVLGLHLGLYATQDPQAVTQAQAELYALYEKGLVKPLISERAPMSDAPAAMARVSAGVTTAKVVVIAA